MITKAELLRGRDITFASQYTPKISDNLDDLLEPMNVVRAEYGLPMYCSSGWRPPSVNSMTAGAAPDSAHMTGEAADFKDLDGKLWAWCLANLALLKQLGLYLEDRRWTPGWVHFTTRRPTSGNRIFIPMKGLAPHPNLWDGKYDSKYN